MNLLITILAVLTSLGSEYPETKLGTLYPDCGIVTENANNTITFATLNGNEFQFYGGEDLEVDDVIAVIFNDKGTPEVEDDEVVSVRYCSPIRVEITE